MKLVPEYSIILAIVYRKGSTGQQKNTNVSYLLQEDLVDINLNYFKWCVFICNFLIATKSHLDIVSGGSSKGLTEVRWVVVHTAHAFTKTVPSIPKSIVRKEIKDELCCMSRLTEVITTNKRRDSPLKAVRVTWASITSFYQSE